jgi:hypothetical protein
MARMEKAGVRHEPVDEAFIAPRMATSRAALGAEAYDAAVEEGRRHGVDVSLAELDHWLAGLEPVPSVVDKGPPLAPEPRTALNAPA